MKVTLEQLRQGVKLSTGQHHRLVLERIKAHLLELDQLCFGFDSAVLLPSIPASEREREASSPRIAPLVALSLVFGFAEQNPGLQVLVAGHTDSVGSDSGNVALSKARAENVHLFLAGERTAWADSCEHHQVADRQLILEWAGRVHGYGCLVGTVDGKLGAGTRRAQERFRREYNRAFQKSLALADEWGARDWEAVYDLYELTLARYVGTDVAGLAAKRALLQFKAPPLLGCGEHWPVARVGIDNLRSRTNRRVDIWFMEDKPHADLSAQEPPGYDLYGHELQFVKKAAPIAIQFLELRLTSAEGHPVPEAEYKLTLIDGSVRSGKLDRAGNALERNVPEGAFRVEYGPPAHIRACALAARLRHALDEPVDWAVVYAVISEPPSSIELIEQAYAIYFNSLSGAGLREDLLIAAEVTEHELPIDHLLACARVKALAPESPAQPLAYAHVELRDPSEASGGPSEDGVAYA